MRIADSVRVKRSLDQTVNLMEKLVNVEEDRVTAVCQNTKALVYFADTVLRSSANETP